MEKAHFCEFLILLCLYLSANENETTESFGGRLANAEEIPYQVSIHLSHSDEFLCGGAIVSSNKVLTLAHCLYYSWGGVLPPLIVTVKAGGTNTGTSQIYEVSEITFHEQFDSSTMEYDLATIEISTRFPFETSAVDKISLAKDYSVAQNNCVVTGWNEGYYDLKNMKKNLVEYNKNASDYFLNHQ